MNWWIDDTPPFEGDVEFEAFMGWPAIWVRPTDNGDLHSMEAFGGQINQFTSNPIPSPSNMKFTVHPLHIRAT